MIDVAEIRQRFDEQVRAHPPQRVGCQAAWVDGVLRNTGAFNLIEWWDFDARRTSEIVAREAAFFGALGSLRWKVYDHDAPANLCDALAAAGFIERGGETFMALDLEQAPEWPQPPAGIEVRRVENRDDLADLDAVGRAAFPEPGGWSVESLAARLADPTLRMYVAYDEGRAVSSGRLELREGPSFAGLYGGSTVPDYRGRGVYRALVARRAADARRTGHRYLTVDARETSRPILERIGFTPICGLRPWNLAPPASET